MRNWQDSLVLIKSKGDRKDIGTGFVIYRDQSASYIVTCAHVVKAVEEDKVKVNGKDATVIAYGWKSGEDSLDLAVLQVEGLDLAPFNLQPNAREQDTFFTKGFFRFDEKATIEIREVNGKLKYAKTLAIREGQDFIKGWELEITSENLLQEGYSGSPILNEKQQVIGVVTHLLEHGRKGAAISIDALAKCWLEMPSELLMEVKTSLSLKCSCNDELVRILNTDFETNQEIFLNAYQLSLPKRKIGVRENPKNATELIGGLTLPKEEKQTHSYIDKFVGYLLEIEENVSLSLKEFLTEWAEKYIKNYEQLIEQLKQKETETNIGILMIAIKSDRKKYGVEAWLVTNIDLDKPNYQQLKINEQTPIPTNKNLTNVPKMVRDFIQNCIKSTKNIPKQIHIFLPSELMNYPVDCWKISEEKDEYQTIGGMYEVIVRSSERLGVENDAFIRWLNKKELVKTNLPKLAKEIIILGDSQEDRLLERELIKKNAIAVKITTVFKQEQPGKLLWRAFVPLALWIRQELCHIDSQAEIDLLLKDCCLQKLPEKVKEQRFNATYAQTPETHLGYHLCLFWDDPNLLAPTQLLTENKL